MMNITKIVGFLTMLCMLAACNVTGLVHNPYLDYHASENTPPLRALQGTELHNVTSTYVVPTNVPKGVQHSEVTPPPGSLVAKKQEAMSTALTVQNEGSVIKTGSRKV